MWANGRIIKPTVKEFFIILTEMSTKENGLMIKQMETAPTLTQMEPNTSDNGKMINKMDREWRSG